MWIQPSGVLLTLLFLGFSNAVIFLTLTLLGWKWWGAMWTFLWIGFQVFQFNVIFLSFMQFLHVWNGRCQCCEPQLCFEFTRGVLSAKSISSVRYKNKFTLREKWVFFTVCFFSLSTAFQAPTQRSSRASVPKSYAEEVRAFALKYTVCLYSVLKHIYCIYIYSIMKG